jgi:hypothetical protein
MTADHYTLTSKKLGTIDAQFQFGKIMLRAHLPAGAGVYLHTELSAETANELGHWLLSVSEELRLREENL